MNKKRMVFYSVVIVILLGIMSVCSYFLYYFYDIRNSDIETNSVLIKEKASLNYSVDLLNENLKIVKTPVKYQHNTIDKIKGDFSYSVSFDKRVKGEYSYSINGKLIVEDVNGEKVLNRQILDQPLKRFSVDGNIINVADNFVIPFQQNYSVYLNYVNNYGTNKGYIIYEIDVNYMVHNNDTDRDIANNETLVYKVPLNESSVTVNLSDDFDRSRREGSTISALTKPIYYVIIAEFIGAILLCSLVIIYILKGFTHKETKFKKHLNTILKKYDDNIIKIKELPNLTDHEVLFVDNIKDLVDASNTFNLPIHYINVIDDKEVVFIILNKKRAYVYKLSEKDLRD